MVYLAEQVLSLSCKIQHEYPCVDHTGKNMLILKNHYITPWLSKFWLMDLDNVSQKLCTLVYKAVSAREHAIRISVGNATLIWNTIVYSVSCLIISLVLLIKVQIVMKMPVLIFNFYMDIEYNMRTIILLPLKDICENSFKVCLLPLVDSKGMLYVAVKHICNKLGLAHELTSWTYSLKWRKIMIYYFWCRTP